MRLNAAMKQQVVQKAMDHKFKKRVADNKAECLALGTALWDHLYGHAKRAMAKVPPEFFHKTERVGPHYNPNYFNAQFTVAAQRVALNLQPGTPIPYSKGMIVNDDQKLIDRCRAWQGDCEDLKAEQEKVSGTLTAMLQSMQTYARLEADWPEGKRFYQSLPVDFPFNHQVPAVQVKELNALLGLAA